MKCFSCSNRKTYDAGNGSDNLDGISAFSWVQTRLIEQDLSGRQSNIGELSEDPATALRAVVRANVHLAVLVHDVLPARFLVIQVNRIVCR